MTIASEEPQKPDPLKSELKFVLAIVCAALFALSMMYLYDQFFYYANYPSSLRRGMRLIYGLQPPQYVVFRFISGLVGLTFGLFSGRVFGEFIYRKSKLE